VGTINLPSWLAQTDFRIEYENFIAALTDDKSSKIYKAITFATFAHGEQLRKYTNEPYVFHSLRVALTVKHYTKGNVSAICAAILHDVVEDTEYTISSIEELFGSIIAKLVFDVTDLPKSEGTNREFRKEDTRKRLAVAEPDSKTVKLADLLDNAISIINHDPKFAKVFLEELNLLLPILQDGGNTELCTRVSRVLIDGRLAILRGMRLSSEA
jgi:(p)ppGpp synthase/HD superfamily hydrolase